MDRPVAVPGRLGHAGARGAPAQVALLHAPGHGHHDVRPGPGHLVPPGGLRGTYLGDPARRLGRRSGGGGAAGDAARADGPGPGRGQDARHRNRRGLLRGRARAVGRRQQRRRARTRRRRRLRAQYRHEHRAAQGRHRGDHDRGVRARQGPRRRPLHDLPDASAIRHSEHTGRHSHGVQPEEPQLPQGDRLRTARARLPAASCPRRSSSPSTPAPRASGSRARRSR